MSSIWDRGSVRCVILHTNDVKRLRRPHERQRITHPGRHLCFAARRMKVHYLYRFYARSSLV